MSAPLRVVVVGAAGRMGRFACEWLADSEGFELVARLDADSDSDVEAGAGAEEGLSRRLADVGADVGLDLTVAGLGARHGLAMLEAGVRPVIGTSGVTPAEDAALDTRARELGLGGLVVPNFCVGVVLLNRAAEQAARWFSHAEITETHRPSKRDAPSGTALDTARRIARAREASGDLGAMAPAAPLSDEPRARGEREAGVSIHSLRLPGVDSRQEVVFGGEEELLVLRHEAQGPRAFGPGIAASLRYAATAAGVARGLEHALDSLRP